MEDASVKCGCDAHFERQAALAGVQGCDTRATAHTAATATPGEITPVPAGRDMVPPGPWGCGPGARQFILVFNI
jgi:hypothetical protein